MTSFSFSKRTDRIPRDAPGFPCPKCRAKTRVIDSRNFGENVRRGRRCMVCTHTFHTEEIVEDLVLATKKAKLAKAIPLLRALAPLIDSLLEDPQ
jgi:hypothetical protein